MKCKICGKKMTYISRFIKKGCVVKHFYCIDCGDHGFKIL